MEISNELGIPRTTVQERLNKLTGTGVIMKFVAIPDYPKIGKQVTACIFVTFRSEEKVSQRKMAEDISKIPGVYKVAVISGEWDILLEVRVSSVEEIGKLVVDKPRATNGVEKTETCVTFQVIRESF